MLYREEIAAVSPNWITCPLIALTGSCLSDPGGEVEHRIKAIHLKLVPDHLPLRRAGARVSDGSIIRVVPALQKRVQ